MIVSWNWLKQYVNFDISHDELVDRLTMSGLNFEGSEQINGDHAIDLEVTSNRPDCLGHIGVAREIAVLFDLQLTIPDPTPKTSDSAIGDCCSVEIECPELCQRYTARLVRGVRVGPSPDWLVDRLATIGVASINNVVDATNYVMFECGQPLHAFDFAKVADGRIIVREPLANESIEAIDHRSYSLEPGMCVIADSKQPVAIGGVMGGAFSEISDATTDVLVEAAWFDPLSIRKTARRLNLHSPSSFRFERNVDSAQIDWASRRCCEIILETGGGELFDGFVDVGSQPADPKPIVLRHDQLQRILGIEIPAEFSAETLKSLGLQVTEQDQTSLSVIPPSWRKDLTREVDLVEEVGRIYGYENVPDDAPVPMAASYQTRSDRVLNKVRAALTAAGFDEAMTPSLVPQPWSDAFSPWSCEPPMTSSQPMLGVLEKASQNIGAVELVRRSLVPSLLEARRINEHRFNSRIELFETAKVYLTSGEGPGAIPLQPTLAALCSGRDFFAVKGILEGLLDSLCRGCRLRLEPLDHELLDLNRSGELQIDGRRLGFIGAVSAAGLEQFGLRAETTVAEFDLAVLESIAELTPQHQSHSQFPAVTRDFNLVVGDEVRWSDLEQTVRESGGEMLEEVSYRETFRDEQKDGSGKKRVLMTVTLRRDDATLTGEQADQLSSQIIESCQSDHGAVLLA